MEEGGREGERREGRSKGGGGGVGGGEWEEKREWGRRGKGGRE